MNLFHFVHLPLIMAETSSVGLSPDGAYAGKVNDNGQPHGYGEQLYENGYKESGKTGNGTGMG